MIFHTRSKKVAWLGGRPTINVGKVKPKISSKTNKNLFQLLFLFLKEVERLFLGEVKIILKNIVLLYFNILYILSSINFIYSIFFFILFFKGIVLYNYFESYI